jgi:hypothetical protein
MIRRRKPLRPGRPPMRKTPLRQRSPKRRAIISPDDFDRLEWLHTLPCAAPGAPAGCLGPMTVHHDTHQRGLGQKAPHDRGIPMCWRHGVHDFHGGLGPFAGWNREKRRAWQEKQVARHQALWDRRQAADLGALEF